MRTRAPRWPTERGSVFFGGAAAPAAPATLRAALRAGEIRKLGTALYSADMSVDPRELVLRNRWAIVKHFIPDALIADRSAAHDGQPSGDQLFIVSNDRSTPLVFPGLVVAPRGGPGPLEDDPPWAGQLRITADARTLLDNLAISRGRAGKVARTLSRSELEEWLVRKARLRPDGWLRMLRDRTQEAAAQLGCAERLETANDLIGAVAGTRKMRVGAAPILVAKARGKEWDDDRLRRFEELASYLADIPASVSCPAALPAAPGDLDGELPFYEAYFSNFIEGTEFSVEEARHIVDTGQVPANRPQDAHDILGTYRVVSDPIGRASVPADAEALIQQLKARHTAVMTGRSDKRPGQFKEKPNRAGSYVFVHPDLVEGTLAKGFEYATALPAGLARAVFMLFLVAEVHPFDDGNGRVARVVMNAELSAVAQARILIPIVWRNEYMAALRAVSRDGRADLYVRTLSHAWRWSAAMPWDDQGATEGRMETTNALLDSTDAEQSGRRLTLP